MNRNNDLLHFFVEKSIISAEQAETVRRECKGKEAHYLNSITKNSFAEEKMLYKALAEYCAVPFSEMDMLTADKELLSRFNLNYLKTKKILPLYVDNNGVLITAISNPMNIEVLAVLALVHIGEADFIVVPPLQLERYIDSLLTSKATSDAIENISREARDRDTASSASAVDAIAQSGEDDKVNAPAVQLVDSIIKEAIPLRASDIHIEPFEDRVRVRYRIDGELIERASFPMESYRAISARIKIMSGINIAERRIPQDGRTSIEINNTEYDFRVSTLPTMYGEKFVIRVMDKNAFNFSRRELGFTDAGNALVDKMLAHPHGIILLTGPTGCGKSTSLYTFLKELNKTNVNIVTVEDPIEHGINGVNQVQVNPKADMTFAAFIRSILRQDPNIIMIGEIRDNETAQIAIRAAITGHLVFSTVHTNDAPSTIERLEDMGVDSFLLADALVGVISQRLVKKLCPVCRKKQATNPREMLMLGIDEPAEIYQPVGCQYCNNTGYKGRTAVHEIMYMDEELRQLVNDKASGIEIRKTAQNKGMLTLSEVCKSYVLEGITSLAELMAISFE